jgi:hypothetical protein
MYAARASASPRLAAIVRVLVEALNEVAAWRDGPVVRGHFDSPGDAGCARTALARAEAIAKGE